MTPDLKAIEKECGKVYGDPRTSHTNIGLAWTGLLQQHYGITLSHPIPPEVVALMMCMLKCNRTARVPNKDSFDDGHVYLSFAERFQTPRMGDIEEGSCASEQS